MAEKKPKDKKPKAEKSKAAKSKAAKSKAGKAQAEEASDELKNLTPEPKFTEDLDAKDRESELDGCDFEFVEADITRDEDLPKTEGGVA
jgi:hypothetical protein